MLGYSGTRTYPSKKQTSYGRCSCEPCVLPESLLLLGEKSIVTLLLVEL